MKYLIGVVTLVFGLAFASQIEAGGCARNFRSQVIVEQVSFPVVRRSVQFVREVPGLVVERRLVRSFVAHGSRGAVRIVTVAPRQFVRQRVVQQRFVRQRFVQQRVVRQRFVPQRIVRQRVVTSVQGQPVRNFFRAITGR